MIHKTLQDMTVSDHLEVADKAVEKLFNEWNKQFLDRQRELDDKAKRVLQDNLWELME